MKGLIFNIQEYAVQDGAGIRTTVFFKGCPLRCQWCSNPEGQNPYPELMHRKSLCRGCRRCLRVCPLGAVSFSHTSFPDFMRKKCITCAPRPCAPACPQQAIIISGQSLSASELYARVKTNVLYYRNSGGGVTLSGGEPLAQPDFVQAFLNLALPGGLAVGVETCGLFAWGKVEPFISSFDFYYVDLKIPDAIRHKRYTGSSRTLIVQNLKRLAQLNAGAVIISFTVIPEVNDSPDMLLRVVDLCLEQGITRMRLLPYHALGQGKYQQLGRRYLMPAGPALEPSAMERLQALALNAGMDCRIE